MPAKIAPGPVIFTKSAGVTLDSRSLIPRAWGEAPPGHDIRAFNPAVVRFRDRLLMAYRVDLASPGRILPRIAVCTLDDSLQVAPDSVCSFSDTVQVGGTSFQDPRFLVYRERLFVHYNDGCMTSPNRIYLVEVDPDTLAARSPARELRLLGQRQFVEKNWMLFEHDGELLAVYQIAPHTILHVDLSRAGPIGCTPAYSSTWDTSAYRKCFGPLRGGAPPVRQGDTYVSFFHSAQPLSRLHWLLHHWPLAPGARLPHFVAARLWRLRRPLAQACYYAGIYTFAATPPYRPLWLCPEPVLRPEDEEPRVLPRLNPRERGVVYPCGAVPCDDGSWLVSYGVHDERCCLRRIALPVLGQNV